MEQLGDSLEKKYGVLLLAATCLVPYGVKSIRSKKKDWNINLIEIINLIPNPHQSNTFSRNTRHLSEDIDDSDNLDASDDIDRDLDMELELLTRMNGLTVDMMPEIDRFYIA
ncbi:hypothetical protein HAX54_044952 [Datura stramonium]|uniref:Ycf2 N-terminal domain-containing protein n=1 Tax=Datura stramonium TaxID=4076 RepID=A0ABS8SPR3_DATST|nr:hypothetical protein [Datura stramonium]